MINYYICIELMLGFSLKNVLHKNVIQSIMFN